MSQSQPLTTPDLVLVRGPRGEQIHCELIHFGAHAIGVLFPDGSKCGFARAKGRNERPGHVRRNFKHTHAGWYIPQPELDRIAREHVTQDQSRVRPNVAKQITEALLTQCPLGGQYWKPFTEVSITVGGERRRLDVVHLETCQPFRLIGTEVKSGRADFQADNKWRLAAAMVHAFYFAAPAGAISPVDLDTGTGLLEWDGLELRLVRAAAVNENLPVEWRSAAYRGCALAGSREDG